MNPPYPCLNVPPDGFCRYTPTYSARECTSGVSWWASQYTGTPFPTGWGDALNFPTRARLAGLTVNGSPAVNSIMCVPPNHNNAGRKGHVAWVTGPLSGGMVPVIEMNFEIPYGYGFREAPVQWCQFIHLVGKPVPPPDPPTTPPKERDMFMVLVPNGTVYLIFGDHTKTALVQGSDATLLAAAGIPYKATACSNEFYQFILTLPNA